MPQPFTTDVFTPEETAALAPYFTNTDRPVFVLTNLPETVKGALFARYSRSAKTLRRLFLDEFAGDVSAHGAPAGTSVGSVMVLMNERSIFRMSTGKRSR